MDEIEEGGRQTPYDHPVIATLAGAATLMLGALLAPRFVAQQPLGMLIGAGVGLALLLWAVGFVVTTRYSTLPWKLGSLAVLVLAGAGVALVAHGQYETLSRADASSFAEVEFGPGGAVKLPAGVTARGPLSKRFAEGVATDAQEQRDFGTAFGRLGVANLTSPYLLEQDPKALSQCDAVQAMATLARSQATARLQRSQAMIEALDKANLPAKAREGIAIMAGPPAGAPDPRLDNQLAMVGATSELCTLLAQRGWFNNGGYFGFRSGADETRFRTLSKARMELTGQVEAIERGSQERMAQGRDMVRDVLSKSIFEGS
jgi:hypothetical protein